MELRLRAAAGDPDAYREWLEFQRKAMMWVAPDLREHLVEQHKRSGPMAQYHMLDALHRFDVRERLSTLQPPLLLIRGTDDPGHHPETEQEIQEYVPGARLVRLSRSGHFPATEQPHKVNRLIETFMASL
jgi:pimeloyl-ACP methyl ester carboxylesterase